MLEKGIVYIARLMERLELRPNLSGAANPKSSTAGSIFSPASLSTAERRSTTCRSTTRATLAGDFTPQLQRPRQSRTEAEPGPVSQPPSPATGSAHVHARRPEIRKPHLACPLVDGPLDLREGVSLRVHLAGLGESIVGYEAIKNSDVIDTLAYAPTPSRISGSRSAPERIGD